ncbi:hypothetical protein NRB56_40850 [Nocardia sp. RB56]|uniref:Uncharacterized protein n=1 Tax=Nocardia aurantia TaxID=2585199 RepID=A0A7K0DRY3_9NOCA|nr:hypothetical protein [Nocardia aurantia]
MDTVFTGLTSSLDVTVSGTLSVGTSPPPTLFDRGRSGKRFAEPSRVAARVESSRRHEAWWPGRRDSAT